MYQDILNIIWSAADMEFDAVSARLQDCVNADADFLATLQEIGTIPEFISHDSTEEKLFSKASDAVLARAFREIGLKSKVLTARGDSADVIAESPIFGYVLVADAKAFRLSRTAKNQKDFKVAALSSWRQGADYAVLCAPYFHYPSQSSQIYAQALQNNVCLLSWEHLIFLVQHRIRENRSMNLSALWNFCDVYSHKVLCAHMSRCFLGELNRTLLDLTQKPDPALCAVLHGQMAAIIKRGAKEIGFWESEMQKIRAYSREQAVQELIQEKKIPQKISQIDKFVRRLPL